MNIKKEFEHIDNHFSNISKEQLINDLKECGLKTSRQWIIDNTKSGACLTWNSDDKIMLTVKEIEELALTIATETILKERLYNE